MKRRRRIENVPTIKATEFAVQWRKWWTAMQPEWRLTDHIWPLLREAPAMADWSGLLCGGANGLFLIILTLSWWAQAAQNDPSQEDFFSAVDDVLWVMTQASMGLRTSKKRQNDDVTAASPNKKYFTIVHESVLS
jgi:hypothetical protein